VIKRNSFVVFALLSALISYASMARAEGKPFVLANSIVHKVESFIVPNQIYDVQIALPSDYQSSPDKEYPIVVVLDGQWNFTLVAAITGSLAFDGMMPEAITVGITWGGEGDDPGLLRQRDFVRPEVPYIQGSGGASQFLSALTEELIPFVESRYRVGEKRVLLGASLGGLFTSYAMVENPGYFDGYIALASSYSVDAPYLEEKLNALSGTRALKGVRSFMGVGELGGNLAAVEAASGLVRSLKLKGLRHKLKVFRGLGHSGVGSVAYTYGLQYVFKRPALKLSEEFLQQYAGDYSGGFEGQPPFPFSVSVTDVGKITLSDGYQTFEYLAESETKFYVNGTDFSLEFFDDDRFVLNLQGAELSFNRVE